ncbi:uncharacterized protein PAC_09741 [Phialocephala subalpina]|uniref:Uncharacterized protein n=1 Tax=Phialocephala subalpina TaxID=576137 RepID=A0A1L7X4C4_9HELO|nr:uncharacterized protein PAC_09741 [Phialocephala subalpina]
MNISLESYVLGKTPTEPAERDHQALSNVLVDPFSTLFEGGSPEDMTTEGYENMNGSSFSNEPTDFAHEASSQEKLDHSTNQNAPNNSPSEGGQPYSIKIVNASLLIEYVKFEALLSGLADPSSFPLDNANGSAGDVAASGLSTAQEDKGNTQLAD